MDFLNDSERQYIEQDTQRKRAVAVGRLSELALAMQNTEQVLDVLRETDIETARKIGKAAREVVTLLERLTITEVAELEESEAEVSQQAVEIVESVVESEAEVAPQFIDEPESMKAEEQEPSFEPAERWLQQALGDDWREKIGAKEGDSIETLAEKVLSKVRVRKNKGEPADMHKARLVGLLKGQSPSEIAKSVGWGTPAAISQFNGSLKKRLNKISSSEGANDQPDAGIVVEPESIPTPLPAPRLQVVPRQRTEVVAPVYKEQEPKLEQLPDNMRFAKLLEQQLQLSSTERVSLESFLDPKSRGEMTDAKKSAVEKVVQYLRPRIESPEYKLTPEELKWIRQCFGIFVINGTETDRPPVPLVELRRNIRDASQGPRVEQAVFSSLQKLLVEGPQGGVKELYLSEFMQAALDPSTVSEERFGELRRDLITMLEKRFNESVAHEIDQALENDTPPARVPGSSPSLREAFARIRQLIGGESGSASTTGNGDIDFALRRFVAVARVGSMAAEMNEEELNLYQRRVVAGLYVNLQQDAGSER